MFGQSVVLICLCPTTKVVLKNLQNIHIKMMSWSEVRSTKRERLRQAGSPVVFLIELYKKESDCCVSNFIE